MVTPAGRSSGSHALRSTGPLSFVLCLAMLAATGCQRFPEGPSDPSPSISTAQAPLQQPLSDAKAFQVERSNISFTVTPRFRYSVQAVVLHRESYYAGWQAELAPCDLALGWGELIARDLHHRVRWSQGGRWYHWRTGSDFPENNSFVAKHSANTHIVPANDLVAAAVCALDADDDVALDGMLVDLRGQRGTEQYVWKSSTSRDDRADGSCEVMWVTRVRARGRIFE
ncbi:MAG: hypothetical protein U0V87_03140 [Acidobacteriota bacterium]